MQIIKKGSPIAALQLNNTCKGDFVSSLCLEIAIESKYLDLGEFCMVDELQGSSCEVNFWELMIHYQVG